MCGARPEKGGRWRVTARIPVNCPRCLLRLSVPRLALCRIPVPARRNDQLHIRLVGTKGFKPKGPIDTRTLCGRVVMLDEALLETRPLGQESVCPRCLTALPQASDGRFDKSHAVR